ncbi:MAG: hypothetical protein WDW38_010038 [Sanguina aurantia]
MSASAKQLVGGAFATQSMVAVVLALVVVVVGLTLLGLIQASLHGIYAAALYRFAETGETSGGFNADLLGQAFRVKGR